MSTFHRQIEEGTLIRFAAGYIARVSNRNSLITPTCAVLSKDSTRANIYISVFPDTAQESAILFLRRHQRDFFMYLKKEARFAHIPSIHFIPDEGEKNRQHLDELFHQAEDINKKDVHNENLK